MELCVLASGSGGNCLYVAGGDTRLLIDAGLTLKEMKRRLDQHGLVLDAISAVLFTHDHADHCQAVGALHRRHPVPFYANEGTAAGIDLGLKGADITWNIFETGSTFRVGSMEIDAFSVPHDAADAVGFTITDGRTRLGVATDLGMVTTVVRNRLADCDALVLESNHDVDMLRQSGRPWSLIQRILGRRGHLSNEDAADLLASVVQPRLKTVILAHLSGDCNRPSLAEQTMRTVLSRAQRPDIRLEIGRQDTCSALLSI